MKKQYATLSLLTAILAVAFFSVWPPRISDAQSAAQIDLAVQQVNPQAGASVPYAVTSGGLIDRSGKVSVTASANALVLEGATRDSFQTTIAAEEPVRAATITVTNRTAQVSGAQAATTVAMTADGQTVTPGTAVNIIFTSDNATGSNRTIVLSGTGAISGQVYILRAPATNAVELPDSGTAVLSAAWTPDANDILSLLWDGTSFVEVARSAN